MDIFRQKVDMSAKNRIVIFIPTKKEESEWDAIKSNASKSCGCECDVRIIENKDGVGLSLVYNRCLNEIPEGSDAICVFMHDDVTVASVNWGRRLLNTFNTTEYGIIGVAGTSRLGNDCIWWSDKPKCHGVVCHKSGTKIWLSKFGDGDANVLNESVCVDGLFIAVDKDRLACGFDEDMDRFHFYDVSFCLSNIKSGIKVGVETDIHLIHSSIGELDDSWEAYRVKCNEKYGDMLPIEVNKQNRRR